jgi:hypothetical protein
MLLAKLVQEEPTVDLFTSDPLHMNNPLLAVDLNDLAFPALVSTSDDGDLIVLSYWDGACLHSPKAFPDQLQQADSS